MANWRSSRGAHKEGRRKRCQSTVRSQVVPAGIFVWPRLLPSSA